MKESYRKLNNLVWGIVMIGVFHLIASSPEAFAVLSVELLETNGQLLQGITVLAIIGAALKISYLFSKDEDNKKEDN